MVDTLIKGIAVLFLILGLIIFVTTSFELFGWWVLLIIPGLGIAYGVGILVEALGWS